MNKGQHSHRFMKKQMARINENIKKIIEGSPSAAAQNTTKAPPAIAVAYVNKGEVKKVAPVIDMDEVYAGGFTMRDCDTW